MCRAGWNWSSRPARPGRRNGLTLIELMVVVVVMAVLAGAIVPNLVSVADRRGMDRAVADVADVLDFAAAAAVARRQPVAVHFDPEHCACRACLCVAELPWLGEGETQGAPVLASLRLPDGVDVVVVHAAPGQTPRRWEGEGGTVRFWPDGQSDEAEVQLSDAHGRSEVVPVRSLVGEVVFIEED